MRLLLPSFFLAFVTYGQKIPYKSFIETLCSPSFQGRGYVHGGDSIAGNFIAAQFQELGLKSIAGNYFQSFSFPVQTFPGACTMKMNGKSLTPGIHFLVAPHSGPSCESFDCSTGKTYEVHLCNLEKLYQAASNFYPCPKNVLYAVKTFGLSADSTKVIKKHLQELSSFAPVMEITRDKFTWSVSQTANTYPLVQVQDSIFNVPVGGTVELHIVANFIQQHLARNVIGFVPAKRHSKKKPYLCISAHYDHLGRMGVDTYFPGANDNASGVGMLYSLANEFVKDPLKHYNVMFIAFAGEEIGLLGSKYYVAHPCIPLKDIRFVLNLDIMGSGEDGITCVNSTLFKNEYERLIALNEQGKWLTNIKPRGPAANSDHYFFTEAGVPAFFIYTMGPNKNYHDIYDKYEALSFAKFDELISLLSAFIRGF